MGAAVGRLPFFHEGSARNDVIKETSLMINNDDAPGVGNPMDRVLNDLTGPVAIPHDSGVGEPTLSDDPSHVVYNPLPASGDYIANQQKALRRTRRQRTAPAWLKRINWFPFTIVGIMKAHDPNFEEHEEQWQEQQQKNQDWREPQ